jgi:hypothetical protein
VHPGPSSPASRPARRIGSNRSPVSLRIALPLITPPSLTTRAISTTARAGSGKQCSPVKVTTRSNDRSSNGSCSTSAIRVVTCSATPRSAATLAVRSSIFWEMSAAT